VKQSSVNRIIIAVFFLSGFSGLIYESIWSHYLKLFLGHAAYAQTLVLTIFMGGMAIGSWFVSKKADNILHPIRWYALIELTIGILAIVFHDTYIALTEYSYSNVIPAINTPLLINIYKWAASAFIILPQAILLGATFPLLASALIRRSNKEQGKTIALLYFSNSLGAVFGVLTSGFLWIDAFGLPGTILNAGYINIWLALFIVIVDFKWPIEAQQNKIKLPNDKQPIKQSSNQNKQLINILLVSAALTGMASFFYEIGWIRMLSMVLGSSSHAFELMLSGFILGIAVGGYWIRKRIDGNNNVIAWLAWIQLIMGLTAIGSLLIYNFTFDVMKFLMAGLGKNDIGYFLFNISSHLIVLLLMLPTTICAGMTLPLVTYGLIKDGAGEKSIGAVYSINTLGGILGITIVVHFVMPVLGLKSVILSGAAIDMIVAISLFYYLQSGQKLIRIAVPISMALLSVAISILFVELDAKKMSSSVFRSGAVVEEIQPVQHFDGKTSSIDVFRFKSSLVIATNGKPDASIALNETNVVSPDELTMMLAAAIPLSMHLNPKKVANIGIGSGLTSHTLLADPRIQRLDNIEIEQKMVEGAKLFGASVERTFTDKRSKIIIEDAKTHFSAKKENYNLIISEPSNPWVSGVSTLFSTEFYHRVSGYLTDDGLFIQWFHLYETEMPLVATVLKAMGETFNYYDIYSTNDADILVVASLNNPLPNLKNSIFKNDLLSSELQRVGVNSLNDIKIRRIATKRLIAPFFEYFDIKPNSDFYPVLENSAVKARYIHSEARELVSLIGGGLSLNKVLGGEVNSALDNVTGDQLFKPSLRFKLAREILDYLDTSQNHIKIDDFYEEKRSAYLLLTQGSCNNNLDSEFVLDNVVNIFMSTLPYLETSELNRIVNAIEYQPCVVSNDELKQWVSLFKSLIISDYKSMSNITSTLLSLNKYQHPTRLSRNSMFLVSANMLANLMGDEPGKATAIWNKYSKLNMSEEVLDMAITPLVIYAHASTEF
jgi:spermidine synthase